MPTETTRAPNRTVMQDWTLALPFMQQTVLLTAIRGPDNTPKYGPVKMLMRWYRRCVLLSAMDGRVLATPVEDGGGSFTGPSVDPDIFYGVDDPDWERPMSRLVDEYLCTVDALPHHFHLHFMHAAEIVGYKHPDQRISEWWLGVYIRFARDMHLQPELQSDLDERLGDNRSGWLKHADQATVA